MSERNWRFSDILLIGRCGGTKGCGSTYPMKSKNYGEQICPKCLKEKSLVLYLGWIKRQYPDTTSATLDIDLPSAVRWDEDIRIMIAKERMWDCPECNTNNFEWRTTCYKCDTAHPLTDDFSPDELKNRRFAEKHMNIELNRLS